MPNVFSSLKVKSMSNLRRSI